MRHLANAAICAGLIGGVAACSDPAGPANQAAEELNGQIAPDDAAILNDPMATPPPQTKAAPPEKNAAPPAKKAAPRPPAPAPSPPVRESPYRPLPPATPNPVPPLEPAEDPPAATDRDNAAHEPE